jgi:hypothetical protein
LLVFVALEIAVFFVENGLELRASLFALVVLVRR